jgi:hypothetical protein
VKEGLGDHAPFVPGDIQAAGIAKVEYANRAFRRRRARKIAREELTNVLGKRDAQIARAPPGAAVEIGIKSKPDSRRHDRFKIT